MANYNLVVNSLFRPFSYLELVAPLQLQTDMHNQLEDAYGELATKANIWDNMANELTDPHAYKMYKSFANDLKAKADLLATEGLTPSSRQAMIGMKARYSKDIVPIELAYARRRALLDELRKALLADPTLMFQRNLNLVGEQSSLDRFIENPNYDYGEMYSGKMLTALAALAASALAKQMRDNPRKWRSILHGQYYETLMLKGFTPEAVLEAIQNSSEAAKELTRIVEDTIGSSKIKNWGDKKTVERAYDYARQGLWSAVGETLYLTLNNGEYLNPLQRLLLTTAIRGGKDEDKKSRGEDITSFFFAKDRLEIPKLLDGKGKLLTNPYKYGAASKYNLRDAAFNNKEGKFKRPEQIGGVPNEKFVEQLAYYNKINSTLLNNGYKLETLNNMTKSLIEKALQNIVNQNKNDVTGRNLYRFPLNASSSEYLTSKLQGRGMQVKEITGLKDGAYKYGATKDFTVDKGEAVDILYDDIADKFSIVLKGNYYEMPRGMISEDTYTLLKLYTSPEYVERMNDAKAVKAFIENKMAEGKTRLSDREINVYDNAVKMLSDRDKFMGSVGDEFLDYVGTHQIN